MSTDNTVIFIGLWCCFCTVNDLFGAWQKQIEASTMMMTILFLSHSLCVSLLFLFILLVYDFESWHLTIIESPLPTTTKKCLGICETFQLQFSKLLPLERVLNLCAWNNRTSIYRAVTEMWKKHTKTERKRRRRCESSATAEKTFSSHCLPFLHDITL